jgi:hypothetical protein
MIIKSKIEKRKKIWIVTCPRWPRKVYYFEGEAVGVNIWSQTFKKKKGYGFVYI